MSSRRRLERSIAKSVEMKDASAQKVWRSALLVSCTEELVVASRDLLRKSHAALARMDAALRKLPPKPR